MKLRRQARIETMIQMGLVSYLAVRTIDDEV